MRSAQLSLTQYDSDKIEHRYLECYDPVFEPFVNRRIALLELGVYRGGSLLLWRDYFPDGTITGIDLTPPRDFPPADRVRVFQGNQTDTEFLSRVAREVAPEGFDIIIDDASHIGQTTKVSFWHLFDHHLKSGGIYAIEDWGTGYWEDWPDGESVNPAGNNYEKAARPKWWKKKDQKTPLRSHEYGMVGFVKQLVDEQGASAATRKRLTGSKERDSKFKKMTLTPAIVFIEKA